MNMILIMILGITVIMCSVALADTPASPLFRVQAGSQAEKFFLKEESSSPVDQSVQWLGAGRVVNPGGHFTYRIPATDLSSCILNLEMGNRYRVSISRDNVNWTLLTEAKDVTGLSNFGVYPVDVSSFLPADKLYVKFEDSQNQGFGCWLRSMTVVGDRIQPRHLMTLGKNDLIFDLNWVYANSTSPVNKTTAQISMQGSIMNVKVICNHKPGYKPVAMTKTRDGEVYRDDCVELFIGRLAQKNKAQDYTHLAINAANTQFDEFKLDNTINYEWKSFTTVEKNRWIADFRIDLSKLNVNLSKGDSLLFCVSRFDDDAAQIAVSSPMSDGLHKPVKWSKLLLKDKSAALPEFKYDVQTEVLASQKNNMSEVTEFIILDEQNNSVYADSIQPGESYTKKYRFEKPGAYKLLSYCESGLTRECPVFISQKELEKFEAQAVSPLFYAGETARINYTLPSGVKDSDVKAVLLKSGKPIKASTTIKNGFVSIKGLNTGDYELSLSIESASKTITNAAKFVIRKATNIPLNVYITAGGYIKADGKFFSPIVMFLPQDLADVRSRGFNTIVSGSDDPRDPKWIDNNRSLLDDSQKNGLKVMLHLCNLLRGENQDYDNLKLVIAELKNHPALFGWYMADEPSGTVPDFTRLGKAYKIAKSIDKNHPVIILDNVPMLLKTFAPYCDILASDPYPVPSSPLEIVSDWTKTTLAASTNKCIMICLQGHGAPFYTRHPTFQEQQTMLKLALENGAKAIGWWAHGPMKESGYWERYIELTKEAESYLQKRAK